MSRLGLKSAFAGYLGNDFFGQRHLEEFSQAAVNTDLIIRGDSPTPLSAVLVKPDGKRTVVNHKGDAAPLPAGSLDRVFILFPDPWPKTRHHKRRIVARPVLDRLAQLMKPGAELRIATDDPSYREWILERVTDHPWFDWTAAGPDDWRRRSADWPATRYEKKALKAGRKPVYLRLSRRAAAREKA